MKAAFLVRCSTDKQDYDRQVSDLNKVTNTLNFVIDKKHIFGENVTGKDDTTKGDRDSIIRLRSAAENKEFDVILINEVSRMSRDSVSGRVYIRQFNNMNIPVYFRDRRKWTIDLETREVDFAFEKELGSFFDGAAEYLKSLKTQTASGRRQRLEDNQMIQGQPAFGYTKLGGKDKRTRNTVIVDLETSKMVVDTYNIYLEKGSTLKSTAISMTAKYGVNFSVGRVNHILNYTGYHTGQTVVNVKDPDRTNATPEVFVITFDPILDEKLYTAAKKKLSRNRNSVVPHNAKQKTHLISRLIKCSFCGHSYTPMRRADKRTAYNWLCMSRINNSAKCDSHINLNSEKMNDIIWNFIKKELLVLADINTEERQTKIALENENISRYESEIVSLSSNLEIHKRTQNRAYTAYINAPDGSEVEALERYNNTLQETKIEMDYLSSRTSILKQSIEESNHKISRYSQTDYTESYLADIDSDFDKKRSMFIEHIKAIYPYKVKYRIVVLEVHTVEGVFSILLNGNQRNNKAVYYIDRKFAIWQNSNDRYPAYNADDYFLVTFPSLVMDSEETEEMVTFDEMIEICKNNDWVIYY